MNTLGVICSYILFLRDKNKFLQKKYRLLELFDIYLLKHFTGLGLSRFLLSLHSQPCFFYAHKTTNHPKTIVDSRYLLCSFKAGYFLKSQRGGLSPSPENNSRSARKIRKNGVIILRRQLTANKRNQLPSYSLFKNLMSSSGT